MISETLQDSRQGKPNRKAGFAAVFDPIARSPKPMLGIPRGPQISSFDGPVSIIAEDLAPYVRSIVSFDRRLEQQRRQLSALLSQPGKGGNRARTTRASRAALEGGSKAHTRRERWFPGKTNFNLVLESGGNDWQEIAMKRAMAEVSEEGTGHCASTKFPLGSAMESDA